MESERRVMRLSGSHAGTIVGRVCLSAIFLFSGLGKLTSPQATVAEIAAAGLPFPTLALALAAGVELLGGGALLAGFKVRWAAGILAAFTVVTAVFFHSNFADPNQLTHFLKNISMAGGLLLVAVNGQR